MTHLQLHFRRTLLLVIFASLIMLTRVDAQQPTLTTLYSFSATTNTMPADENSDGASPTGLCMAGDGSMYGTTTSGGAYANGTVFRITQSGSFTLIHTFSALSDTFANLDGANPGAALIKATNGNLYGTTYIGGINGNGTVFEITTAGTFATIYNFSAASASFPNGHGEGNSDGELPACSLCQAGDGNLYGTASYGGENADGTVFKITTAGKLTTLHNFNGLDGAIPVSGLVLASNGWLYGTTQKGGLNGDGTVFKVALTGSFKTLHSFTYMDGAYPIGSLIQASDDNLYGSTTRGARIFVVFYTK